MYQMSQVDPDDPFNVAKLVSIRWHFKTIHLFKTIHVCTVRAYQGQQAPIVILTLVARTPSFFDEAGRPYTAVLRAQQCVALVGNIPRYLAHDRTRLLFDSFDHTGRTNSTSSFRHHGIDDLDELRLTKMEEWLSDEVVVRGYDPLQEAHLQGFRNHVHLQGFIMGQLSIIIIIIR